MGISIITLVGITIVWHRKLCIESFFKLEFFGGVSALIGAKLWDMIVTSLETSKYNISLNSFLNSGYSFYGGLLLGLTGVFITSVIWHIDFG